jgi:phosphoribosylanthranilate isomerase
MKKIVIGNWKMNPASYNEALKIFNSIKRFSTKLNKTSVIICPPFVYSQSFIKKNKDNLIEYSINKKLNTACLFDCSGGKGISPVNWPNIKENIFCGYAGGLGPDNIEAEIKKIILLTNNNDFWIDMESKVRTKTSDLDYLDLDKVKNCLIQVKKYV